MILVLGASGAASAQERAVVVVVDDAAHTGRARAWQRRLEEGLGAPSASLTEQSRARSPVGTAPPEALSALVEIEALLVSARASAARLEERRALTELTRAEALARRSLALPGIAAWYAEVQLALAITAAQAGQAGLADAALRRAASVDPSRVVQAAEARPDLVERSRAAVQAAITGPRGRFEVSAGVEGARVFLDDRPLGALPRVVEATVGAHVLRVDAPGHASFAQLVEVLEGERAPIAVELAPTSEHAAALRALAAAREGRARAVADALGALGGSVSVWLVWAGAGARDRAVAVRCAREGCDPPRRLERERVAEQLAAAPAGADLPESLAWMDEASRVEVTQEPWWERWYVWVGAGAILAAAVAAIVAIVAQPDGPGPLGVTVVPNW